MRVVVALGGNALLQRGEPMTTDVQRRNVRRAAPALATIAADHELVLSHGNGPQVGLLALQAAAYTDAEPSTLDVLGAQTQGMIAYLLEQELRNSFPATERFATIMTMVEVDQADPAFENPTKFVGPVYTAEEAAAFAAERGWAVRQDGPAWRRVVPSPRPQRVVETRVIRALVESGTIVVCAGGGGVPVVRDEHTGRLRGVEAVVDKDQTAALLAEALDADALLLLTDVPAVVDHYGTPQATPIHRTTPAQLRSRDFPAGSMGPKVDAACRFVELTGNVAAIGALDSPAAMLRGTEGTVITPGGKP